MSEFIQQNYVYLLIILILFIVIIALFFIKKCSNTCDSNSSNSNNNKNFIASTTKWKQTCYIGWSMNYDTFDNFIDIAQKCGITHIILEFIVCADPFNNLTYFDTVKEWQNYSDVQKTTLITKMNKYGITLMVSFGGATSFPQQTGGFKKVFDSKYSNSSILANELVDWMYKNKVYGIDLDIENLPMGWSDAENLKIVNYLGSLSQNIKNKGKELGVYIVVSHAPQTPYYNGPSNRQYYGGQWGYTYNKIEQLYGAYIDFYNLQYYNQGNIYNDYKSLFIEDGPNSFNAAILQLINADIVNPLYFPIPDFKLVVGKPNNPKEVPPTAGFINLYSNNKSDLSMNNYIHMTANDPNKQLQNWYKYGGIMIWIYKNEDNGTIKTNDPNNIQTIQYFTNTMH